MAKACSSEELAENLARPAVIESLTLYHFHQVIVSSISTKVSINQLVCFTQQCTLIKPIIQINALEKEKEKTYRSDVSPFICLVARHNDKIGNLGLHFSLDKYYIRNMQMTPWFRLLHLTIFDAELISSTLL